jgi:hypothetical protein
VLPLLGLLRNYKEPNIELEHSEEAENVPESGNSGEVEEEDLEDSDNESWEEIN